MSTDDNPGSPPPLTAAEIASIEAGIYAGNTVPLKLERAIGQAAQSKAFIEIDINGVPMLVGPDSILGDAHTQGSLLHTYEHASRAPRKGDANPSGRTMEDAIMNFVVSSQARSAPQLNPYFQGKRDNSACQTGTT